MLELQYTVKSVEKVEDGVQVNIQYNDGSLVHIIVPPDSPPETFDQMLQGHMADKLADKPVPLFVKHKGQEKLADKKG